MKLIRNSQRRKISLRSVYKKCGFFYTHARHVPRFISRTMDFSNFDKFPFSFSLRDEIRWQQNEAAQLDRLPCVDKCSKKCESLDTARQRNTELLKVRVESSSGAIFIIYCELIKIYFRGKFRIWSKPVPDCDRDEASVLWKRC